MPEMSGIEVCKKIRESWYVPILFLTAKSSETDKLEGFSAEGMIIWLNHSLMWN